MDPVSVITLIGEGLSLVDKFTDVTRKWFGKEKIPSTIARRKGDALNIEKDGQVVESIAAAQLQMSSWDQKRYDTLQKKVKANWNIYNNIDGELPTASIDEKSRLLEKLDNIRQELCNDFHEMIRLYEDTLGIGLEDHYSLYDTCGG